MTKYCVDLDLPIPLFKSTLAPFEFLKENNKNLSRHYQLDRDLLSDDIIKFFADHGFIVTFVDIFYRPAGVGSRIHSDTEKRGDYAKLNWVYGGEGSIMNWYTPNQNEMGITDETVVSTYAVYYKPEEVTLAHSQIIGTPTLVQVGVPHSVDNNVIADRYCVSIAYNYTEPRNRPTFNESYEIFKNYIS
jgi:hypothetical protein